MKNTVHLLDDGRVEIIFATPFHINKSKWLLYGTGWSQGSEILVEGDKVVGVRCHPHVWEYLLEHYAPVGLKEFRQVVEELKREALKHNTAKSNR
jgi:hypothetical protein